MRIRPGVDGETGGVQWLPRRGSLSGAVFARLRNNMGGAVSDEGRVRGAGRSGGEGAEAGDSWSLRSTCKRGMAKFRSAHQDGGAWPNYVI